MRCYGPWKNADLTERLIALRKAPEKHSFSEIAQLLSQEFNLDITRNAVLGAPTNFSVELADFRVLVSFELIGGRSQKTAA